MLYWHLRFSLYFVCFVQKNAAGSYAAGDGWEASGGPLAPGRL